MTDTSSGTPLRLRFLAIYCAASRAALADASSSGVGIIVVLAYAADRGAKIGANNCVRGYRLEC